MRGESLKLIQQLRDAGKVVEFSPGPMKGDKQFKRALELPAKFAMRLEAKPDDQPGLRVKNLQARTEEVVALGGLAAWVAVS